MVYVITVCVYSITCDSAWRNVLFLFCICYIYFIYFMLMIQEVWDGYVEFAFLKISQVMSVVNTH